MKLSFTLHGKLTSNNRVSRSTSFQAKPYKSGDVKKERARIGWIVRAAMTEQRFAQVKWFKSTIISWNTRLDLDNIPKMILDCLNKLAVEDDRYHIESHQQKRWDDNGERFEVVVEAVEQAAYDERSNRTRRRASDAAELVARRPEGSLPPRLPPMAARLLAYPKPLPKMPRKARADDA
jgi:Holliday junction resolvase RusA-like endonuclease